MPLRPTRNRTSNGRAASRFRVCPQSLVVSASAVKGGDGTENLVKRLRVGFGTRGHDALGATSRADFARPNQPLARVLRRRRPEPSQEAREKGSSREKVAAEQSAKWKAEREAEASLMADPMIRAQTLEGRLAQWCRGGITTVTAARISAHRAPPLCFRSEELSRIVGLHAPIA
jgi:hypothetical protein